MFFRIISTSFVLLLCYQSVDAISVEKTVLFERQSGVFVANVRAAFNSKTKNTLIIWERHPGNHPGHSIWGRLLLASGVPTGASFQIVAGPNTYQPDLIYNADKNQFLLVYANEISPNGRFQIQAQRLNLNGRRIGQPVRISLASDLQKSIANYTPKVVYDAETKGYVIVWIRYQFVGTQEAPDDAQGLYGVTLNSDLTVRKSPLLLFPLQRQDSRINGPYITDVEYHAPSKKLLIAGYSITNDPGFFVRYFVSKVDPTLEKGNIVLTPLKGGLSSGAAPSVHLMNLQSGGKAALFVEGSGLKKRNINSLGTPVGPITFFLTGSAQNIPVEFPATSLSSMNGQTEVATIAIEDSTTMTGKLWLQTLNGVGAVVGQAIEIQSGFDTGAPPVISALPNTSTNGFFYAVVYVEGVQLNVPPGPNESSGLILLRVNTAP